MIQTRRIYAAMNGSSLIDGCWDVGEFDPINNTSIQWFWYDNYTEAQLYAFSNIPLMILEAFHLDDLRRYDSLTPSGV